MPIPKGGKDRAALGAAPSVLAPGSALGSVPTVALSSAQVKRNCTMAAVCRVEKRRRSSQGLRPCEARRKNLTATAREHRARGGAFGCRIKNQEDLLTAETLSGICKRNRETAEKNRFSNLTVTSAKRRSWPAAHLLRWKESLNPSHSPACACQNAFFRAKLPASRRSRPRDF